MSKPQPQLPAHHPFADPNKWELMLLGLAKGMSVSRACAYGGLDTSDAYKRRREDPQFAECWAKAVEAGTDILEDEAFKRSTVGKSDYLLSMLLRARRPNVYCDKTRAAKVSAPPPDANTLWMVIARLNELGFEVTRIDGVVPKLPGPDNGDDG